MNNKTPVFHAAHYNIIAAQFKQVYSETLGPTDEDAFFLRQDPGEKLLVMAARTTIEELALRLAKRFVEDNIYFNPVTFLNACSPNTDLYPLGELWQE